MSVDLQTAHAALLSRVLESSYFRRSSRLRDFLTYAEQHAARSGPEPLHEQDIGAAVFGRHAGYDTGVDNIVRVNATELRKRLELYFSTEGVHEPVVLEMPRGSYNLVFRPREAQTSLAAETETASAGQPADTRLHDAASLAVAPPARRISLAALLLGSCALLLAIVLAWLATENLRLKNALHPWRSTPALRAFWKPFFNSEGEVDLVLADASFALAQDLEQREIPLASYLNYDYKRHSSMGGLSADRQEVLDYVLNRNNGSIGDFIVASRILALDSVPHRVKLQSAREYSTEAIRGNNIILIGSRKSNPWVDLYQDRLNFLVDYDVVSHRPFVRNRSPLKGEPAVYNNSADANQTEGYSVIAFLPNLSRTGAALLIQGTDSQATRAAGEFVTTESALQAVLDKLGSHGDLRPFEILLHNLQLTGTPFRSEVVAYRALPAAESGPAPASGGL